MSVNIISENKTKDFKINVLVITTLLLTLILIFRLAYLQIFQYKTLSQRAQYSTSRISIIAAPRGIIYDRNGKIIATNKESISLIVYPNKLKTKRERMHTYNNLIKILKAKSSKLKEKFQNLPENYPLPIRLQSNISLEEAIQIIEKQHMLPGINIQKEPIRYYPNGSLASHIVGYISQIDEDELNKRPNRKLGDLVGKYGVEKLFDDILRGTDGKDIVEVDRLGKPINISYKHAITHIDSIPGRNITLTIDSKLQKTVEEALMETMTSSTALVVNPNNGEVLALASYPNFDPNIFTKPLSANVWRDLLAKKTFLNRALLAYTPGSTWKPITLIAALDAMVIKPNDKFYVSEAYYLGKTRFGDWTSKGGIFSLQESLAWSRDTAFYQIGRKLTPSLIKIRSKLFGAGRKTGIELLGEERGIVPDEDWKQKNIGEPWYPGNTLHYAIGQGFVLATPVQIARIYSAIATGYLIPKLQVIKKINNYIKINQAPETYKLDPNILTVVRDGLKMCVEKGTGTAAKIEGIKIAGKTGSAEVHAGGKTHGWFVGYAPLDKPEIVVVALLEKAGHGGTIAAPIVKKILESYFQINTKKVEPQLGRVEKGQNKV